MECSRRDATSNAAACCEPWTSRPVSGGVPNAEGRAGSPGPPLARPRPAARRIERRMAAKRSAGILLHRERDGAREVLLVHPGGPFWARKNAGAWSIPKGEYEDGEDARACAMREFG